MKRTITQLLGIGLIIGLSPRTAKAQNWLGMSNSNYGGIHTVYQNPSNIADRKSYASFNFYSLGTNVQNNYLTYNAPFKATHWDDENRDNDYRDGWFLESLNGNVKDFSFTSESRGLSLVIPWGENADLAFHSRTRVGVQAQNIDEWTARILKYGIDSNAASFNGNKKLIHGKQYTTGEMSLNTDAYQELNASLAGVLYRGKKNFLKGGFTLKFLRGLGGANLYANNVNSTIFDNDSIEMQGGTLMFNHTSSNDLKNTLKNTDGAWWNNAAGYGLGLDLGLTYEYRPNGLPKLENCNYRNQHSNYKFKIGMALTDIGGINYFKKATNTQFDLSDTGYINIGSNILDDFKGNDNGFEKIDKTLEKNLNSSSEHSFYSQLPTAININMDYKVSKKFYVAANWYQNIKSKEANGLRQASFLSISPRLETSIVELGMPITIAENYSKVNLGLNARVGPFFVGTENVGGLIKMSGTNNFKGADLYGGVSLNIGRCWVNKEKEKRKKIEEKEDEQEKEIIEKTILKHDTIYITKTKVVDKTTEIIRLENELKKQRRLLSQKERELIIIKETRGKANKDSKVLEELKRREAELDKREKELRSKSSCKDCEDELAYIKLERRNLKNRISVLENQVRQLQKDVAYWKNRHRQTEIQLEIVRKNCDKVNNDEIRKNKEIEDRKKSAEERERRAQLERERERQKRIEAEAKRKREAEARRKAQIQQESKRQEQIKRQQEIIKQKQDAEEKEKRAQLQRERERQQRIAAEAKRKREAEVRRKAQIQQESKRQEQIKRQEAIIKQKQDAEEKEKRAQLQRERERQQRIAAEAKRKREAEARRKAQIQQESKRQEQLELNKNKGNDGPSLLGIILNAILNSSSSSNDKNSSASSSTSTRTISSRSSSSSASTRTPSTRRSSSAASESRSRARSSGTSGTTRTRR